MSFTTLPPELQDDVMNPLPKSDLLSLCLVSKSFLHLARPLLYRSIEIHLDSWDKVEYDRVREMYMTPIPEENPIGVIKEMQAHFEERECRQNKLIQTLEAHQDWKDSVQQISLSLNAPVEDTNQATQTRRLLSSCRNLQSLSINSAHDEATGSFFLQHIPPSLTTLDFEHSQLPAPFVLRLLDKLPLLETLSLANDQTEGLFPLGPDHVNPRLSHLRSLTLSHPFRSRSFFSVITSSTNSLSTLVVDFIAVQALVPERLSTITSLSILGELYPLNLRYGDYSQNLVSNLAGVFNGCHSLRYLKIASMNMMGGSSQVGNSEFAQVLPHLPKHLETLVLSSIDFGGDHVADFLSTPHRHLRQLVNWTALVSPMAKTSSCSSVILALMRKEKTELKRSARFVESA